MPKWCPNDVQMMSKWCPNDGQMMPKWCPKNVQMMPLGSMPLLWEGGGWWVDVKEFKYWFASRLSYLFLPHYAGTVLLDAMICLGRRTLHVENGHWHCNYAHSTRGKQVQLAIMEALLIIKSHSVAFQCLHFWCYPFDSKLLSSRIKSHTHRGVPSLLVCQMYFLKFWRTYFDTKVLTHTVWRVKVINHLHTNDNMHLRQIYMHP